MITLFTLLCRWLYRKRYCPLYEQTRNDWTGPQSLVYIQIFIPGQTNRFGLEQQKFRVIQCLKDGDILFLWNILPILTGIYACKARPLSILSNSLSKMTLEATNIFSSSLNAKSKLFFSDFENTSHPLTSITFILLKSGHLWNIANTYREVPHNTKSFDCKQRRDIRLINNAVLSVKLAFLDHRRDTGNICLFYR